jgi:hypothetical protein
MLKSIKTCCNLSKHRRPKLRANPLLSHPSRQHRSRPRRQPPPNNLKSRSQSRSRIHCPSRPPLKRNSKDSHASKLHPRASVSHNHQASLHQRRIARHRKLLLLHLLSSSRPECPRHGKHEFRRREQRSRSRHNLRLDLM